MNDRQEQLKLLEKVVDATVSANHTIFKMEELSHQNQFWMKEVKKYGNLFLKRLMKTEGHFDLLEDNEQVIQHAEEFHDFMEAVRPLDMNYMKDLTEILQACKKDRLMMLGVARRINDVQKNDE